MAKPQQQQQNKKNKNRGTAMRKPNSRESTVVFVEVPSSPPASSTNLSGQLGRLIPSARRKSQNQLPNPHESVHQQWASAEFENNLEKCQILRANIKLLQTVGCESVCGLVMHRNLHRSAHFHIVGPTEPNPRPPAPSRRRSRVPFVSILTVRLNSRRLMNPPIYKDLELDGYDQSLRDGAF
jgi:hypothetical protein